MGFPWKFGIRYDNGKLMFYRAAKNSTFYTENPGEPVVPSWAVDIREIIAMIFAGTGALCLIFKDEFVFAMIIFTALVSYATGRTVPGGKTPPILTHAQMHELVKEIAKIKNN